MRSHMIHNQTYRVHI